MQETKFENMPVMVPIRIQTKGLSKWAQVKLWLTMTRTWMINEPWHCTLRDGTEVVVPAGFTFDGASIPRVMRSLLAPVGILLIPGLLHDYAYRYDRLMTVYGTGYKIGAGQAYWDKLFREVGEDVNGMGIVDAIAWAAVKVGGKATWDAYRRGDSEEPR